ncbi:MAG: hypothetical protein QXT43_02560, partial [Candidatus Micrarchaeaceae archaeon]
MPKLYELINSCKGQMVKAISEIVAIPAIAPQSGGSGESKRADYLEKLLYSFGQKPDRFDYKDASGTVRSNLVTTLGNA